LEQTLIAAAGIPEPKGEPLVHFSPGVAVRIGAPKLIKSLRRISYQEAVPENPAFV
jgi:hypothetical protein